MLKQVWILIITFAAVISLAVTVGYATHAVSGLTKVDNAKAILNGVAIAGWICIALDIILFLAVIIDPELIEISALRFFMNSTIYVTLFGLILFGILLAYSASLIKKSKNYSANKSEYSYCVSGAFVGMIAGVGLLASLIGISVYKKNEEMAKIANSPLAKLRRTVGDTAKNALQTHMELMSQGILPGSDEYNASLAAGAGNFLLQRGIQAI